jgi:hypothetical protein
VTYVYDRGYVGCIETKICDQERESSAKVGEVFFDIFSLGMMSMAISDCIMPCQKGYLEIFFDQSDHMIGARELPTDRSDYCWRRRTDTCEWYYKNRLPISISKDLILDIDPEDIPEKICDIFKK